MKKLSGFTLIELLIVVAIIAILAAIAVPNFLEAQTRAKVSRVKSDLRTMTTALESYRVDHNKIPADYNVTYDPAIPGKTGGGSASGILHPGVVLPGGALRAGLTTPIAYVTNCWLEDPFIGRNGGNINYDEQVYTYNILERVWDRNVSTYLGGPNSGGIFNVYYGEYRLGSIGPDRTFYNGPTQSVSNGRHALSYDATNGTTSYGNIWRTPKFPEGAGTPPGLTIN